MGDTGTNLPIGYTSLDERKGTGSHYTPKILSDFVAEEMLKQWSPNNKTVTVMDPAIGDGELLISLIQKLNAFPLSQIKVQGFDTDNNAITTANNRLSQSNKKIKLNLNVKDFLEYAIEQYKKDLFSPSQLDDPVDLIIANPPYVRTQVMGATKSKILASDFGLKGRIDLYHAFLYCIARVIKPGGIVGIIVSNRFMTTQSGSSIRKDIVDNFEILHVWDLGDTQLFEAAVLPAVLILKRKCLEKSDAKARFSSIYKLKNGNTNNSICANNALDALRLDGHVRVGDSVFEIKHGQLDYNSHSSGVWRISTNDSDQWLKTVKNNTSLTFGDIDKIRVGVKTTADKVFIRTDWEQLSIDKRPELLKPLTTHHIARRYKALDNNLSQILYTHEVINGKKRAIDIYKYPKSLSYLLEHKEILDNRDYIKQAKRNWFEIWVPQDPDLWVFPKMVFRDISEKPTFWLDLDGSIVNGDCYWIAMKDKKNIDLLWLALAVANSTFIEVFYDHSFNNKLYSGRRRYITQYVEKFPIPDPNTELSKLIIKTTKDIFNSIPKKDTQALEKELDTLVWKSFGFNR